MHHQTIIASLLAWFDAHARDLPWRRSCDPYAIWVSEIMLQQTQVKTVLPYWSRWMRALPTVARLARARSERIHKLWEGLGYYARVRNMQKAAHIILRKHAGQFPNVFEEILALPGVGPYTAGALASIAFNQPRPILDGNVTRVLTRCFGVKGDPRQRDTNARLWQLARELVQGAAEFAEEPLDETGKGSVRASRRLHGQCSRFNQSLMELGALVCTPREPRCSACPVAKVCVAFKRDAVGHFPEKPRRAGATSRRFAAFVVRRGSRFLVRQRPAGMVNAHLWEFPNLELTQNGDDLIRAAGRIIGARPASLEPLCTIKHSITRYRMTLEVYRAVGYAEGPVYPAAGRWLNPAQLRRLAFSGAHRRILGRLQETKYSTS